MNCHCKILFKHLREIVFQVGDESSILPPKLQAEILEALSKRQKPTSE